MSITQTATPKSAYEAFALASMEISRNEVVRRLSSDFNGAELVAKKLMDMGQRRLINLTHNYNEARIALAMYAGNGIVLKVIPKDYLGVPGVIYHIPSIATEEVQSNHYTYVIKAYPWVGQGNVTAEHVEEMREKMARLGISVCEGDDHPRNFHRIPDADQKLVGIDSSMFCFQPKDSKITPELENAWHDYVHTLYPIYNTYKIPAQTAETDFSYLSLHDRQAEKYKFEHDPDEAANAEADIEKNIHWWNFGF